MPLDPLSIVALGHNPWKMEEALLILHVYKTKWMAYTQGLYSEDEAAVASSMASEDIQ